MKQFDVTHYDHNGVEINQIVFSNSIEEVSLYNNLYTITKIQERKIPKNEELVWVVEYNDKSRVMAIGRNHSQALNFAAKRFPNKTIVSVERQ